MKVALYFGCYDRLGHYLRDTRGTVYRVKERYPGFPWEDHFLDGGLLRNGKIPDEPDGRVHWTAGGRPPWHAFYWWDRSGDKRGNSGSGFYVCGFGTDGLSIVAERKAAFEFACAAWPDVVSRQVFPLTMVLYPRCGNCGRMLGKGSNWDTCPNEFCEDAKVVLG
jgi:hypothetical protein